LRARKFANNKESIMNKIMTSVAIASAVLMFSACNKAEAPAAEATEAEAPAALQTQEAMQSMPTGDQPQGSDMKVSPNLQEPGMGEPPVENAAPVPTQTPAQ
jgi:hypothetical protein